MNDRALADGHPLLISLAQQFLVNCKTEGIDAFITEIYRSEADQNADYACGRTAPGKIITNAQYGESPHNCVDSNGNPAARAFDFAIMTASGCLDWNSAHPNWRRAIAIGEELGLVSGSHWHDPVDAPHLELPNWKVDNSSPKSQVNNTND